MLTFNKIKAKTDDSHAMIIFHGYGGDKNNLIPLLNIFTFQNEMSFYFLEAPYRINEDSYSWSYEIEPGIWERDEPGRLLDDFFNNIIFNQYEYSNIFLLGFSQGAFICFEYGLNIKNTIGGIFPIAGFTGKNPNIHKSQKNTPVIIGHGLDDQVINKTSSENAYNYYSKIKKMNNIDIITYKGGHKIGLKYLKTINQFMKQKNIK